MKDVLLIVFGFISIFFGICSIYLLRQFTSRKKGLFVTDLVHMAGSPFSPPVNFNKQNPTDEDIHNENFIKFLSESRDWAFSYIESVQAGLSKFIAEIDPHIKYYDEYGVVADGSPHDFAMKKISVAYKELKTFLPEKIND